MQKQVRFSLPAPNNQALAPSENQLGTLNGPSSQPSARKRRDISLDLAMGVAPTGTRGSQDKVVNLAAAYGGLKRRPLGVERGGAMVQPEQAVKELPEPKALRFSDRRMDAVSEVGAPSLPPIMIQDVEMADIPTTDASTNFNGSTPEVPKAGKQPWAVRMLKRKARLMHIAQIVSWTEETNNLAAKELMQRVRTNGMQVTATEPITFAVAVPWSHAEDATHGKEDAEGTRGVTIQMAMQQAINGFEREAENHLQLLHIQGVLLEALDRLELQIV